MSIKFPINLLIGLAVFLSSARAGEQPVKHRILLAEYGKGPSRLVEVSADGKLLWEHKLPSIAVIFQVLPGGDIVYAYGGKPTGVQEIDRKHQVVWNYESKCPQVLGCQRLPNGNTLVAEQGPCQVVEVDPMGPGRQDHQAVDQRGAVPSPGAQERQRGGRQFSARARGEGRACD